MAGGRRIPVTVEADTKGDFDTAADGLGKVAKKADDADGSLRKMSKGAQALDDKIGKAAESVKALRSEFERTGDIDLLKDARKLDNVRKNLERLRKDFADAGEESGKTFTAGLQGTLKTPMVGPAIAAGLAAAITLGAPAIGAAVTAAVGGGAIAGGILLAAKDPRVEAAWSKLGTSAMASLTGAASPFVDVLVHGAETFDAALGRIMPNIEHDFAALAPVADRLFDGAAGFVERLMPGIDALTAQAGPTLTMVARELPRMGAAVSDMMESIADGGEGGRQALRDLLVLTEALIVSTGRGIEGFEKLYQFDRAQFGILAATFTNNPKAWDNATKQMLALKYGTESIIPVAGAAAEVFKRVTAAIVPAGREAELTGDQFKTLSGQINATLQTSDVLAGQMVGKLFNSMMSVDQATLGFAESQTSLSKSIEENGRQLDIHKEKGQANREAILGAVQANMAQYQANISVGMSAADAALAYDANTQALERQLRQAGFTQGAIDGLIGKYRNVPDQVNTDIAMKGLTEAIQSLDDAIRLANNLDGRKVDTYVTNHVVTRYSSVDERHAQQRGFNDVFAQGGIRRAQVGLIIPPSNPGTVLTAEPQTGGEVLIPMRGIDTSRAAMLGQAALGNYGLDVVPRAPGYAAFANTRPPMGGGNTTYVNIPIQAGMGVDGPALARQIAGVLRPYISSKGGDVQVVLGGH